MDENPLTTWLDGLWTLINVAAALGIVFFGFAAWWNYRSDNRRALIWALEGFGIVVGAWLFLQAFMPHPHHREEVFKVD